MDEQAVARQGDEGCIGENFFSTLQDLKRSLTSIHDPSGMYWSFATVDFIGLLEPDWGDARIGKSY
jgi:hypothetical protein